MKSLLFTTIIAATAFSPLFGMPPEKSHKRKTPAGVLTRSMTKKRKLTAPSDAEITAFFDAINDNNVETILDMLDEGFPANAQEYGINAVTMAAIHNHQELIRVLVRHGAGIDGINDDSSTPLIFAARYRNTTDENYHEGLHGIEELLACGAHVAAVDSERIQALRYAVMAGKVNVVRLLIRHLNGARNRALAHAWPQCPLEIINLSLSFLPSLHLSTKYCDILVTDAILFDHKGSNLAIIEELLAANDEQNIALHFLIALDSGKTQVAEMFITSFLDQLVEIPAQERFGRSALFRVAAHGYSNVVKCILERLKARGATAEELYNLIVQHKDVEGRNMLECADARGRHNIVEMLVAALQQ
ncbi:MAG: ankyrin repeat domain-containing protein [Candidatus Babeliales bacterium]